MPGFNWASTSRSRKLVALWYPADALVRLQLGLDLAVEETRHHQGQVRRGEEASIGPRPRGRGNLLALSGLAAGPCRLQLGLDLAVEETKRHDAEQHAGCPASIGPRPRGRGNLRALREIRDASDELQLGLDLAVEETRSGLAAMRRVVGLQLGLDLAVEETLPSLLCPRSRYARLQLGLDLAVEETLPSSDFRTAPRQASIGPRPRGRGNPETLRPGRSGLSRFNWASTSRSRKPAKQVSHMGAFDPLQLGLDLAVEETTYSAAWAAGPAACFNWASTSRSRKLLVLVTLDLGHQQLQLGLDLAVEETHPLRGRQQRAHPASIGPRPRGRGNTTRAGPRSTRR